VSQALETIISLKGWYLTANHITECTKPEFLYFIHTMPTTKFYPSLYIFLFTSFQRDMNQNNLSAELLGKYRILWLRWSQLVSQMGLY
jgi:hypothetical protein